MNSEVELAKQTDVAEIVALCYQVFGENLLETTGCLPDLDTLVVEVSDVLFQHVCFVIRDEGKIDGVFLLKVQSPWWSKKPALYSMMIYVKPEKRSFKSTRNLLNEAKKYAIMNDLPFVIDLFDKKDVKRKVKLLKYMGFKECGTAFIFNEEN